MSKKAVYPVVTFIGVLVLHAIYSIWSGLQASQQWVQIEHSTFLSAYLERQEYWLGLSYALAGTFTTYAVLKFLENRKKGMAGILGGITLTGILYFAGCFLLGCCGSPMLGVYLTLFGSSFLGFTKPLTLLLTLTSVVIGYFWLEKKTKASRSCCAGNEKRKEVSRMTEKDGMEKIQSGLKEGIGLAKCRKCGCMKDTLENLRSSLDLLHLKGSSDLHENIGLWLKQMEPIRYACLGCEYCYPAVAMNILNQAFPEAAPAQSLGCAFEVREQTWPPVPGEYFAFCDGPSCPVAVSTLASVELAEKLASLKPKELCIVGKTETENIGIDKVIKNTITNRTIRFFLLAGSDPKGHQAGKTLLNLWEKGIDENMRVIGSPGKRPILKNVTKEEVQAFRKQVQVVDMIGCEDPDKIIEKLKQLSRDFSSQPDSGRRAEEIEPAQISTVTIIQAEEPTKIKMDKAGYFVVTPQSEKAIITVEHYSYDNRLLRVIQGRNARGIYGTIIENGWITQLSHAAYLGKELERAELSMKYGFKYVQDGATGNYYENGNVV